MVICCEGRSWRREIYPQYKHKRRSGRDDSSLDWEELFRCINVIIDEIRENLPWKVIRAERGEADDIIGALAYETQEFGKHEPVMIISNDKDFMQLQKFDNVKQFSPMKKKLLTEKNPRSMLMEHIFKGDSSDGVPNILSGDDTFVDGSRQTPVTKKKMEAWLAADNIEDVLSTDAYRNFCRNKKMIDLSEIPKDIYDDIVDQYENNKVAPKMKVLNYLIKKRMNRLIECAEEFYPHA